MDRELEWNDVIEKDGNEYVLLPEGDYDFTVESFDRGRHNGSDKLPPCNKAMLKLRVESEQGTAYITHNLFLHTITEGMLSAFFASIGQKRKGEPLRMDWSRDPGASGRAKIGVYRYMKDGEERQVNEVKRFYAMEGAPSKAPTYKAGDF